MVQKNYGRQSAVSLEENLKKAITELLILQLLSQREYYIGEITQAISDKSGGALNVVFPYAAIYRMEEAGHIMELPRRIAPDGRRRQYFSITPEGLVYLAQLRNVYATVIGGVAKILTEGTVTDES